MRPRSAPAAALSGSDSDTLGGASALLWDERDLLEHLLLKLTEEHLLIAAGQHRWLARADEEVRAALAQLAGTELLRAVGMDAVAVALRVPAAATLRELSETAPEPWPGIFAEHRQALSALIADIESVTADIRTMLLAGCDAARHTLDQISAALLPADTRYPPRGAGPTDWPHPRGRLPCEVEPAP
jgi:hypothetical protein